MASIIWEVQINYGRAKIIIIIIIWEEGDENLKNKTYLRSKTWTKS